MSDVTRLLSEIEHGDPKAAVPVRADQGSDGRRLPRPVLPADGMDLAPADLRTLDAIHLATALSLGAELATEPFWLGVISGECGAGKTVAARAAVAGLEALRRGPLDVSALQETLP